MVVKAGARRSLALLILGLICGARLDPLAGPPLYAQTVYTLPATTNPAPCLSAVTVPTASAAVVPNIGQNLSVVTYTTSGTINTLSIQLEGSLTGLAGSYNRISETATATANGALFANVWYPFIRCNLTALTGGGSVTATYFGTTGSITPAGIFNTSGIGQKMIANMLDAGSDKSFNFESPTGTTAGTIFFNYAGAFTCPPSPSIRVAAGSSFTNQSTIAIFTPLCTNGNQLFFVPSIGASAISIFYETNGSVGGVGVSFSITYAFGGTANRTASCDQTSIVSLGVLGGNTQIIPAPPTSLQRIAICHISIAFSAAVTFSLHGGTGTNCATIENSITGNYLNVTSIALDFPPLAPLRDTGIFARAVCANISAGVNGGGVVIWSYTNF